MNFFLLLALAFSFAPQASMATVYDGNKADQLEIIANIAADISAERHLTATHEDLSRAKVVVVINKSPIGSTSQVMRVFVDGNLSYEWLVSTGREQVEKAKSGRTYTTTTPIGYFRPTKLELDHYSKTWEAEMPHAVFFQGGVAIHASTHIDQLGKRASGGCVRLAPAHAATFYSLIDSMKPKVVPLINRNGKTVLDVHGNPVMTNARDVLIIVENHS